MGTDVEAQHKHGHLGRIPSSMAVRRTEVATAEPIDPDQWIRDARAANDDEAVAWLTRMRATNTAPDEPA